jgi:radical SAM enzyme (TIGR01210 family)
MNDQSGHEITGNWIRSCRSRKNSVDPLRPYAWIVEKELTPAGTVEDVVTIFITNRECPYSCLMCDLWKNTTDYIVPAGSIPGQIRWVLNQIPAVKHIKLYNSGSFFDKRAIPENDYKEIASLVSGFQTVIVESHPAFIDDSCLRFRDMTGTDLQIAIGLEIANPEILRRINKDMTLSDFTDSVDFLIRNDIFTRAFILLRPPFLSEQDGIFWAERSIDFAFDAGAECCVIIPVRGGNGAMEHLAAKGLFSPPDIRSLEKVMEYGIEKQAGRVFADTWDLKLFSMCDKCHTARTNRITGMNLSQQLLPGIICDCDRNFRFV